MSQFAFLEQLQGSGVTWMSARIVPVDDQEPSSEGHSCVRQLLGMNIPGHGRPPVSVGVIGLRSVFLAELLAGRVGQQKSRYPVGCGLFGVSGCGGRI
ncbi:hypothetical protein FDP22_06050 [Paroceanicella profunda]|uniref:Uncharacterized protein n=1 Tax=Paroceanicella profunda TaxID=2579971 RepID=A0A5B8FXY8_9RHOB|nr:hypothetical protein [Paroceanicella profunda]QDL91382.1 hypothetical protein FDP22_06050 [Paroceanicella profunda]